MDAIELRAALGPLLRALKAVQDLDQGAEALLLEQEQARGLAKTREGLQAELGRLREEATTLNNSIVEARRALKDAQAQVVAYEPTLATARQAHDRAVKDLKAKQDEEQQKLEAVRAQVSEFRARLGAVS